MKVREAIMRLKNQNKTIIDISHTLGLQNQLSGISLWRKKALVSSVGWGKEKSQPPVLQVRNDLQKAAVCLSETTIRRRLHKQKCRGYTARCKLLVSHKNRMTRLQFGEKYLKEPVEFLKKVLWAKETSGDPSDGKWKVSRWKATAQDPSVAAGLVLWGLLLGHVWLYRYRPIYLHWRCECWWLWNSATCKII